MSKQAENNSSLKEIFYQELTTGQKALFVFRVYYDHAIESESEFYWWSSYYLAQPKIWSSIKVGVKHFRDQSMYLLLEEIEAILRKYNCPATLDKFSITREDLERNIELFTSIKPLYSRFNQDAPVTIKNICQFIRTNSEEFLSLDYGSA
ncbi:hypothetical protein [Sporosarcina sp. Te-1]|uniref:hypothetical protein n=1 Tax=Sporosarcina sp. Te-1 TaxID=2818390 RepID=UPI001A9EC896|nr:hypothetical protein [Sporosarcina sp. Te-1]QTD40447.1 hypothetical protein J3U78_16970 [Sporosarcina sp. Te-1]